ncbi:MAG: DsbA family oxidoreductase [Acidobacteria bacterium]|nr:DsbA family oxidoreductase [Acidobacteriota bacterium]
MLIEVFSDVVCPWCALGARRLSAALDELDRTGVLPADRVTVRWRAFQLDPDAPPGPGDLRGALERKYGPGSFDAMTTRLTALGADEGIDFRFDRALRTNTFDAHRLLAWAAGEPTGQGPLVTALFRAYFTDGADVSDHATLTTLAGDVGLDADGAAAVLAGGDHADEVLADRARARAADITGVPAFVLDERALIPGAQDSATLVRFLGRQANRT